MPSKLADTGIASENLENSNSACDSDVRAGHPASNVVPCKIEVAYIIPLHACVRDHRRLLFEAKLTASK
jgi:hypothetical protein